MIGGDQRGGVSSKQVAAILGKPLLSRRPLRQPLLPPECRKRSGEGQGDAAGDQADRGGRGDQRPSSPASMGQCKSVSGPCKQFHGLSRLTQMLDKKLNHGARGTM